MGYGWTFPVFSEGFICGGEMLSFRILSNALMGTAMTGIQFIHVFSTCSQGKKKPWSASTCVTSLKPDMCHLMWFGRFVKVGENPKSSHWGPCFKPDPSAHLIQEAEERCSAFLWAVHGPTAVSLPWGEGSSQCLCCCHLPKSHIPWCQMS